MVVSFREFKSIVYNKENHTITVGAGAQWGDIVDVVYSDNQCYVAIVEHSAKSIEEHSYRIAGEKRDDFKTIKGRKIRDLMFDIFEYLDRPKDINWVPYDYIPSVHPDYDDGIKYFNVQEYYSAALFLSDFLENNIQHDK